MRRPTLAEAVTLGAFVTYVLAEAAGCASTAPRVTLAEAIAQNNTAAAALRAANAAHTARLAAAIARESAACPPRGAEGELACVSAAATRARDQLAPETARLEDAGLWQHQVADALEAAAVCRDQRLGCEADHLARAAGALALVVAALVRGLVDAGAEGGP